MDENERRRHLHAVPPAGTNGGASAEAPPPAVQADRNTFNAGYPPQGAVQPLIHSLDGPYGRRGLGGPPLEALLPELAVSALSGAAIGFLAARDGRGALIGSLTSVAIALAAQVLYDPARSRTTGEKVGFGAGALVLGGGAAYLSFTK